MIILCRQEARIEALRRAAFVDHAAAAFLFRSAQRFFMAKPIFLRAAADKGALLPKRLPDAALRPFRLP